MKLLMYASIIHFDGFVRGRLLLEEEVGGAGGPRFDG